MSKENKEIARCVEVGNGVERRVQFLHLATNIRERASNQSALEQVRTHNLRTLNDIALVFIPSNNFLIRIFIRVCSRKSDPQFSCCG